MYEVIKKKCNIKTSVILVFITKYLSIIITLLLNMILARIISPEDFGVVAIISIFLTFFNLIADFGMGSAIIQKKNLDKNDINILYTLTFYMSIVFIIFFILISYCLKIIYYNNLYIKLGLLLSISLFFNTINIIPNSIIMKEKQFYLIAKRTLLSNLLAGIMAIIIAYSGGRYYTIIAQSIFSSLLIYNQNIKYSKLKIVAKINFQPLKKINDFSLYWFLFNFLNYFARNFDNLIVGKLMGNIKLANYDKAYQLMLYPLQNLTYVINPILHPILSHDQNRLIIIYDKYSKIVKILSLLGLYISIFCFFSSTEIVLLFFGEKWVGSIDSFKILSISIWFQLTNSTSGAIYASTDKTKLLLKSGLIYIPIQIILFLFAAGIGSIEYIAMAATTGLIIKFFVDFYILITKVLKFSFISFLKIFYPEFIFTLPYFLLMKFFLCFKFEFFLYNFIYKLCVSSIIYFIFIILSHQYTHFKFIFTLKNKN